MPELRHLNALDYGVVAVYLLVVAGAGVAMARYNRGTDDYFKAGGRVPWTLAGISLFVSGFSAFMFVGAAGFTYRNGAAALALFTLAAWGYFLGYLVYGPLWRRTRIDTPMEFLTRRFSQSTTYVYTLLSVIPNVLVLGILIYTLCIFISTALGFNREMFDLGVTEVNGFQLTLLLIGLVLIFYTVLGGLWAVLVTDALQFLILFVVTLLVCPLGYVALGGGNLFTGVQRLVSDAPDGFLDFTMVDQPPAFFVAYFVNIILGYNVNWHIAQRYYSVPDERDTRKMALVCAGLSLVLPIMWILPVMATRLLYPGLEQMWPELSAPSEAAFVTLAMDLLPHGMLGMMVAAMLAATMSSADTTFNWLAAVLTKDVYVPLRRVAFGSEPTERKQMIVGRASVLGIGLLAVGVALTVGKYGGAFEVYLDVHSLYNAPMFVPVLLGLVFTRTPWWSGIIATVAGVACVLGLDLVLSPATEGGGLSVLFGDITVRPFGVELGRYEINTLAGASAAAVCFFASALVSRRRGAFAERIARFEADLRTPAHSPPGSRLDLSGLTALKLTGRISWIVCLLLVVLTVFTSGGEGAWLNALGALMFAAAGVLVLRWTTMYERRVPTPHAAESANQPVE